MRLYFFRHAEAGHDYPTDYERELTKKGIRRTRIAGQVCMRLGVTPARLFSSPRIRARQTADILAEAFGLEVTEHSGLDFGFNADIAGEIARRVRPDQDVMVVGHNPSFEQVVRDITGANAAMKKGGMARIDLTIPASPLHGELVWLIAPRVFDALA